MAQPEGPGEVAAFFLLLYAAYTAATHDSVPVANRPPIIISMPPTTLANPALDPNIYSGNDRRKIRKIAADTGLTEEQVGDAIHEIKKGYFGDTNPDVDVDRNGDVYLPGGEFVGNIRDYVIGSTGERGSKHKRGSRDKW